jgi:hypothetical protein
VLKNIVEVIHAMLADTLSDPESLQIPHLSAYERQTFTSVNQHVVGMLLLSRREAAAVISELCQVRHSSSLTQIASGSDGTLARCGHHTNAVLDASRWSSSGCSSVDFRDEFKHEVYDRLDNWCKTFFTLDHRAVATMRCPDACSHERYYI